MHRAIHRTSSVTCIYAVKIQLTSSSSSFSPKNKFKNSACNGSNFSAGGTGVLGFELGAAGGVPNSDPPLAPALIGGGGLNSTVLLGTERTTEELPKQSGFRESFRNRLDYRESKNSLNDGMCVNFIFN